LQGRGRNCAKGTEQTISGEGYVKEIQSQSQLKNPPSPLLGKGANDCTLTPTPSPIRRGEKQPAFTLAEVLVTLGLIGVVAAMTLPMLAENYQRRVVETRLKKFYTTFNQAILRAVEYHGPSESWNYQFSAQYNDVQNYKPREIEFAFNYYLRDYLNVVQEQQVFYTNGAESKLYYLSDGSAFLFSPHTNAEVNFFPKNAAKCLRSSDSYGVCQFVFLYNPKMVNRNNCGRFYTYHCNKGLEPYMYNWDGTIEALYNGGYGCAKNGGGFYCTALIQRNDWQFPKDYPRKIRY
ncbi:type II secretion system protein, partial [bacterium]|nr:type II secretion system protein [bacterium]